MKLLALLGYPRQGGHTARLAELFLQGAAAAGAEIRRADLSALDVRPCLGCYACWTRTPGRCIQQDAMAALLELFLDADLVFIASPVYAFSVSACVKHFMERTLPLLSPGAEIGEGGVDLNRWRYPGRGPRRMAALLVAGKKEARIVRPTADMLALFAQEMRMRCAGVLIRPESCALRFPQAKPLRTKALLTGVERAGAEFTRRERIPQSLLDDVSTPLLADLPHFVRYSRVFWEHALAQGDEGEAAGTAAGSDVRILIREMVRNASEAALRGVSATLQFEFPDAGLTYALEIRDGACTLDERTAAAPDLRVRCPAAVWAAVVRRTLVGAQLLKHPDLHVEGDLRLFRQLPRYFPPPAE
jgi:putative NADPH-quinone reductase